MILNIRATLVTTLMGAACLAALAGCPSGTNPLATGSSSPSATASTAATASMAPGTTSSTMPASAAPGTTASTKPGYMQTAADCSRTAATGTPAKAAATAGAYANMLLPDGWTAAYTTEAAVTSAIQSKIYDLNNGADWACFQKFYADAAGVFKNKGTLKK